jgi:hypothetical protein
MGQARQGMYSRAQTDNGWRTTEGVALVQITERSRSGRRGSGFAFLRRTAIAKVATAER